MATTPRKRPARPPIYSPGPVGDLDADLAAQNEELQAQVRPDPEQELEKTKAFLTEHFQRLNTQEAEPAAEPDEEALPPLDQNEITRRATILAAEEAARQEQARLDFLRARAQGKRVQPVRSALQHDTESDPCAVFNSRGEPVGTPGYHVATVRCIDEITGKQTGQLVNQYRARGYREYVDPDTGEIVVTPRGVVMECHPDRMVQIRAAQILARSEDSAAQINARREAIEGANRGGSAGAFARVNVLPDKDEVRQGVKGWGD